MRLRPRPRLVRPRRRLPRGGRPVAAVAAVLIAAGGLTGCTGPSASRAASTVPDPSPRSSSAAPTPTPSPTTLTATCDSALPLSAVDQAAGQPVIGNTSFVVGVPEPNIGRLAYVNCRYGLADAVPGQPPPTPLVEIGVSLYDSATHAATRAAGTVEDYREHGATPSTVRLGSGTATVLTGYGVPTLVGAQGARTVAVSVDPSVLTSNDVLVGLAALALTNVT